MSKDVQQIQADIQKAKQEIEFNSALERLKTNRDFKKVILEGYFRDEAIRLVHLKSQPQVQNPVSQQMIVSGIDAIGNLADFFRAAEMSANTAARAIEQGEAEIEEINGEEANV